MNIVQGKCPKCRKSLRIPFDWLSQVMRCKHCREVFQPKPNASALPANNFSAKPVAASIPAFPPTSTVPQPPISAMPVESASVQASIPLPPAASNGVQVAPAAPPAPMSADPFAFSSPASAPTAPSDKLLRTRHGGSGWLTGIVLGLLVVMVSGAAVYLWWDEITGNTSSPTPVAKNNNVPSEAKTPKQPADPKSKNPPKNPKNPNPPKVEPNPTPKIGKNPTPKIPFKGKKYFPRRALLINVNNYLFANHVEYGEKQQGNRFPGSSTSAFAFQLSRIPMKFRADQVYELSDSAVESHPTVKSVIESAIVDFLGSCRNQDRIVLFFAGHAIDGEEDNAYLVPLAGDLDDPESLISMKWVYEQLKNCKAQQKVLILDICRFPTGRGFELPPRGTMGEVLAKITQNPPAGVQVWTSCKAEQYSVEFESGSLFIEALCAAMQNKKFKQSGIQEESDPIPVDRMLPYVNEHMAKYWPSKDDASLQPVSVLSGKTPDTKIYDPAEPFPAQLAFKSPTLKGDSAGKAMVDNILSEIAMIPPTRAGRRGANKLLKFSFLPPFPAASLQPYERDYDSLEQLKKMIAGNPKQYELRKRVLEAIRILAESNKFAMQEKLFNPSGGPVDGKIKTKFKDDQTAPGEVLYELRMEALPLLDFVEKNNLVEKELSRRWKAMYHYTRVRLLSRIIYVFEYSHMLGKVQNDLPELTPNVHNGWVIGSNRRIQIAKKEPVLVRDLEKEVKRLWRTIKKEYAGTPWAMFAKREEDIALGLKWNPSRF